MDLFSGDHVLTTGIYPFSSQPNFFFDFWFAGLGVNLEAFYHVLEPRISRVLDIEIA
jgi:hypothetical protein